MNHTVVFDRNEVIPFCQLLCELIRRGVTFKLRADRISWEIELTGGY